MSRRFEKKALFSRRFDKKRWKCDEITMKLRWNYDEITMKLRWSITMKYSDPHGESIGFARNRSIPSEIDRNRSISIKIGRFRAKSDRFRSESIDFDRFRSIPLGCPEGLGEAVWRGSGQIRSVSREIPWNRPRKMPRPGVEPRVISGGAERGSRCTTEASGRWPGPGAPRKWNGNSEQIFSIPSWKSMWRKSAAPDFCKKELKNWLKKK